MTFYCFYWLGLQTCGVFWRVHESKRLAPASFPLGARRRGNLLKLHAFVVTSCFNGVRLTGTLWLRQIISVISLAQLQFFIYIRLTGQRQRKSVQYKTGQWVMRVFPLGLENQRKSCVHHIANGFHSTPISVFLYARSSSTCTVPLTSDHVCSLWMLACVLENFWETLLWERDLVTGMLWKWHEFQHVSSQTEFFISF